MVGQEPVLYASTVEDNIAYGMDNTDRDTVIAAAQIANAHNFIDAMSKGYKTQTGEKGRLSFCDLYRQNEKFMYVRR